MSIDLRVPVLLLCFAALTPAKAQTVVYADPLPPAAMRDLARLDLPAQPPRVITHGWLPPLRIGARRMDAPGVTSEAAVPRVAPPPVKLAFTSGTSRQVSPADAGGAVGPSHIVGAYNSGIVVHDRTGAVVASVALRQFWAVTTRIADQYDPRIAYDETRDRWILVSIDREKAVLFAVSETGDPAGNWRRFSLAFSGPPVDFSRLAVTRDTVMIATCTGEQSNDSTVVLSIRKDDLYGATGTQVPMRRFDFYGNPDVVPVTGSSAPVEYVVAHHFPDVRVRRLEDVDGDWGMVRLGDDFDDPAFILPQLGTSQPLDGSPLQIDAAQYRNGLIYTVRAMRTRASESAVVWTRFDPDLLDADWGVVEDTAGVTYYAYPSLAVNRSGAMLLGFGMFSTQIYPSAAYAYVDLFGRTSAVGLVRAGDGAITDIERWGDYTTSVVDPLDDTSFWTVQICSNAGTWGTVWANVAPPGTSRRRSVRH